MTRKVAKRKIKTPDLGNAFFEKVLDQAPLPTLVTDRKVRIIYINRQFEKLTGYSLKDLYGKNPRVLSAGKTPRSVYVNLWKTILAKKVWEGEIMNRTKSGHEYWEMLSISPVLSPSGRIIHFVAMCEDITARHGNDEKLKEGMRLFKRQAHTDVLTGVDSRRFLMEKLEVEISRAIRYQHPISVIMADLDHFKKINDRHGHVVGDVVLRSIARILKANIRVMDVLGRYGGDEFVAVLPETDLKGAVHVAERSLKMVNQYRKNVIGMSTQLGASFGVVCYEKATDLDHQRVLEEADKVLLKAKRTGKNKVVFKLIKPRKE